MLNTVELRNLADEESLVTMAVSHPQSGTKYLIKDISGLGPVKASINTTDYGNTDGATFNSSRVGIRNIVMIIEYLPDWASGETVSSLRRALYKDAQTENNVELTFISDDFETVTIEGYVESHEPMIFSKDAEVQISIVFPDPAFRGSEVTINGMTMVDSDPPVIGDYDLIEYEGDLPTGVDVTWTLPDDVSIIQLVRYRNFGEIVDLSDLDLNDPEDYAIYVNYVSKVLKGYGNAYVNTYDDWSIPSGRTVQIKTITGEKFVGLPPGPGIPPTPPKVDYSGEVRVVGEWPTLYKGENYIGVRAEMPGPPKELISPVPYVLKYTNLYGGL